MESLSEGTEISTKGMQIVQTLSAQKVQSWAFGDELVRTIQIENAPFFVAKDVSIALGYKNASDITLDTELEQEKKKLEIAQFRANRYILEHLEELDERKLLTRSAIQGIVGNAAGENSAAAFSDEDMRIKNFIFEVCKVVDFGFVPVSELYERYKAWCAGNCLSRNTFVRRVQKIMGKFVDYKQKRVNGELILVFTGIEFSEGDA